MKTVRLSRALLSASSPSPSLSLPSLSFTAGIVASFETSELLRNTTSKRHFNTAVGDLGLCKDTKENNISLGSRTNFGIVNTSLRISTLNTRSTLVPGIKGYCSMSSEPSTPNVTASEAEDVVYNLKDILSRIQKVKETRGLSYDVRLVAVSKTKPKELIKACYEAGHRSFGENYVQELLQKAVELREVCPEIRWHFIGHLQDNKVKKLVTTVGPQLAVVETVDSEKLAKTLNKAVQSLVDNKQWNRPPLDVFIQVNTSGEASKSGVEPNEELLKLTTFIAQETPNLRLKGLMTIGQYEVSLSEEDNRDFGCLVKCREDVAKHLGINANDLELSMGMSHDFEKAIASGSTSVRVGSSIFGARVYHK